MMVVKNKAFTLIELLAVIVILAIIALIATPIVLNIIQNTKESSYKRSAELYLNATELAIARRNLTDNINPETCTVLESGNLKCDGIEDEIKVEMQNISASSGIITFRNGKVLIVRNLIIGTYKYNKNENGDLIYSGEAKPCVRQNDSLGYDSVVCGTEAFYVMSDDENNVKLFSKKNITVTENNPKQSDEAGSLVFSQTPYWGDVSDSTYVYNSSSNLYKYVQAYKNTLTNMRIDVKDIKIPSYEEMHTLPVEFDDFFENVYVQQYLEQIGAEQTQQMIALINSVSQSEYEEMLANYGILDFFPEFLTYSIENQAKLLVLYTTSEPISLSSLYQYITKYPQWARNSAYWLGSAENDLSIYSYNFIDLINGLISSVQYDDIYWNIGIRPIVTISKTSIE